MTMDRYALAEIEKVLSILSEIEDTDFAMKEFTSKEFNQVFKGTRNDPSKISIDWLRNYGALNGKIKYRSYTNNKAFRPFLSVTRVEDFELPYKEMPWRGYEKIEVLKNAKGEVIDVNLDAYKTDKNYRQFIESQYGACDLVTEEKKTFTAHRFFYKIDLDALKSIKPCIEEVREYYEKRLAKARQEVAKFEKALDLIG